METELTEVVQDGRKARGDRTKRAILDKAVDVASVEGLEGLSIGRLAAELGPDGGGVRDVVAVRGAGDRVEHGGEVQVRDAERGDPRDECLSRPERELRSQLEPVG